MEKSKYLVTLFTGENGYIIAECPALPGCMSQGRTKKEALDNIEEAILLSLETCREMGLPLGFEIAEVEVAL